VESLSWGWCGCLGVWGGKGGMEGMGEGERGQGSGMGVLYVRVLCVYVCYEHRGVRDV